MSDVDMPARVRMGSKSEILRFFNSGWASTVTGNTLIESKYASVRQSRDSLDRGTHKVTKKSRLRRALEPLELER